MDHHDDPNALLHVSRWSDWARKKCLRTASSVDQIPHVIEIRNNLVIFSHSAIRLSVVLRIT